MQIAAEKFYKEFKSVFAGKIFRKLLLNISDDETVFQALLILEGKYPIYDEEWT